MNIKLLLYIILNETIFILIIISVAQYFIPDRIDTFFWVIYGVISAAIKYWVQIMTGREVGIGPNDENWLKTNYASQLKTTKSIEELSTQISNSSDYIGKVSLNGKVIHKNSWRGITRMSTSTITTTALDGETKFAINTRPLLPFTKIDSYTNYKCHREIMDMILDV